MDPRLEPFLTPRPVLDQGILRLVRVDGDDASIVEAARVTTGKGRSEHIFGVFNGTADGRMRRECSICGYAFVSENAEHAAAILSSFKTHELGRCIEGDRRLIRYMLRHKHVSPFAFASITVHFRCPVYVFRQWVRHWSWPFQEYSMRYSEAVDAMQATKPDAWRAQSESNRQGSGGTVTSWPEGWSVDWIVGAIYDDVGVECWSMDPREPITPGGFLSEQEANLLDHAAEVYRTRLAFGVAKEQARKDLPLSNYTDVYATVRVRDLLPFLALRLDERAQVEIRAYAEALAEIVKAWIPLTWEAFVDYQRDAVTFSGPEMQALRNFFDGAKPAADDESERLDIDKLFDMVNSAGRRRVSTRERAAFFKALGLEPE